MSAFPALVLLALFSAGNGAAGNEPADAVLVQFHSTKCGPCRAMHPVVEKLASAGYPLQQIDVDQQPQYAEQFKVRSLPTFSLFSRGREVQRVEGSSNFNDLAEMFHTVGFRPGATQVAQAAPQPQQPVYSQQESIQYTSAPADPANLQPTQGYVNAPGQPAAGLAPAAPAAAAVSPQQRAAWATVRLKVEDERGFSFGTGTVIDRHDDESLVMTCGHIFRQSGGKGKIIVDLFAPGATQPVDGMLIAHDLDRDIALVSVRTTVKIDPVPVAPAGYAVAPRDRVFTIGCDKGAAPSLRNSHIIAVNKYQGAPNFTAEGAPVDGRSGGGLFSERGYLIGICNAADAKDNEGLYAALASVHWQLDQIGQSAIYQDKTGPNAAPPSSSPANFAAANAPPADVAPAGYDQPVTRQQPALAAPPAFPLENAALPNMPAAMPRSLGAAKSPAVNPAAALSAGAGTDDTEVIVILRSRSNPAKQSEIFVMDRPPAEIIRQLQSGASPAPRGTSQDLLRSAGSLGQPVGPGSLPGVPGASPVVRGQSN